VAGKAPAKDASVVLQSISERIRDAKISERLPDMLWLLGEECIEAQPEGSASRTAYKSLVQELLVGILSSLNEAARMMLCVYAWLKMSCICLQKSMLIYFGHLRGRTPCFN
jgi:hypothetical protein